MWLLNCVVFWLFYHITTGAGFSDNVNQLQFWILALCIWLSASVGFGQMIRVAVGIADSWSLITSSVFDSSFVHLAFSQCRFWSNSRSSSWNCRLVKFDNFFSYFFSAFKLILCKGNCFTITWHLTRFRKCLFIMAQNIYKLLHVRPPSNLTQRHYTDLWRCVRCDDPRDLISLGNSLLLCPSCRS